MNITIELNDNYFEEKKYILSVLFEDYLDLKIKYNIINEHIFRIILPNSKKIIINDIFFASKKDIYSWVKSDVPKVNFETEVNLNKQHKLFGLYGKSEKAINDNNISIHNDIIGTSFIFLSRIEELNGNHDKFGRYKYKGSLAHKFNIILRPIINEYIYFLKDAINTLYPNYQIKSNKFEVILSHDIDIIKKWTIKKLVKKSVLEFGSFKFFKNYYDFVKSLINIKNDPYFNFERIMDYSEQNNLKSLFFFMCLEKNEYDFRYNINEVQDAIKETSFRNHYIGIHSSRLAYNDNSILKKEINRLEKINSEVIYNRNHYLMFDVKNTWQILDSNNIKYDLTLGYPEMIGFRCGICSPFRVFDIINKKKLNLIEIPLTIMDVTLTDYMNDVKPAKLEKMIFEVIDNTKKYGGTLNLLWHNNSYSDYKNSSHDDLLNKIIERIK
tara:strand:+ start:12010 stop:13332 length:1323 start_codon:yes stop_codon:yes gene_type:complete